jgi:NodT family efflux transporter outer membrane factor (OMF) lipoprotein
MIGRLRAWRAALLPLPVLLAACTVGPDYQRPPAPVPVAYKEQEGWKVARPRDTASRGPWWSIYRDPVLDGLERQVDISNQNLKAAEAAYRQALALVREGRSGYYPVVTLNGTGQRAQTGSGSSSSSGARVENQFEGTGNASWDIDVWGRIRRTVESDVANAQASAADLAAARLSAQATLASDYFQLRAADELKRLLDATVLAYTRSLEIARNQYNAGTVARSDVVQAETQLKTTQAQAINVGVQRAQLEHAIAILVGKPPAEFAIPPAPLAMTVPVMPPGVPSVLLERRPDIASAERQMASANAQIGIAQAAYYPDLTLSAAFGYASTALGDLFNASNQLWSFGGAVAQTVFDGGLRGAQVASARAVYDQSVANYRQTVLTAFQQVEDELASLRILEQQQAAQADAVRSAEEAVRLALNEYQAGIVAYTTVITAQTTALANEQTALTILQNRLVASVTLIQALGGGWDAAQLPDARAVEDGNPVMKASSQQPAP